MKTTALFLLPALVPTALRAQERPNIVLILADDMGYSDLGCMGSEIQTPNLDALSHQGVLLTQFCNTSKSCPSRTSLLTGLYSWRAGMGDMSNTGSQYPEYQGYLNNNCVTLAEVLKSAGYNTYLSGKWHVGDEREVWPDKRGFDHSYMVPNGGGVYFYPPAGERANRHFYTDGTLTDPTDPDWYSTDAFGDQAAEYVREASAKPEPFFLYLPFIAPHYPLQAKPEDIAKYENTYKVGYEAIRQARFEKQKALGIVDPQFPVSQPTYEDWNSFSEKKKAAEARRMAVYAAQVDCIDQNVGKVLEALRQSGEWDNTVIIFLSDNGAVMNHFNKTPEVPYGDRTCYASMGKWQNVSNTPFRYGKSHEYEGGIKTPLIFSWPAGLERKDVKVSEVAHIIDIMPTVLELSGAKYPRRFKGQKIHPMDGRSIMPLVKGSGYGDERTLYFEHEGWKALRRGDWKIDWHKKNKVWELYNLATDPYEEHDLSGQYPALKAELIALWQAWADEVGVKPWPLDK